MQGWNIYKNISTKTWFNILINIYFGFVILKLEYILYFLFI